MHPAHQQNFLVCALLVVLIVAYLGIAFQFWTRRKGVGARAATEIARSS